MIFMRQNGLLFLLLAITTIAIMTAGCSSPTPSPTLPSLTPPPTGVSPSIAAATPNSTPGAGPVKPGDQVTVDYIGTLQDGTVFDTSVEQVGMASGLNRPDYSPLTFTVGGNQMISGFDSAVVGMRVGETKNVTLSPDQAYGQWDPANVLPVPLTTFGETPVVNQTYPFSNSVTGESANGKVLSFNNTTAMVDFNSDLAGKTLMFSITLRSIG